MWLQKMPFIVKLLLYVIVFLFLSLFIIVALSLMFEPETEEISGWVYTVGFVLSIENNGLHRIREQAVAMKSNIKVIGGRIENILLQLDPVVERQMKHEEDVYLKVSRNDSKKYRHLRSLGEVKASLSAYPMLRSDETVMKLFSQIVKEYEDLAQAKMAYNAYAAQYNSGVKSFPVCLLGSVKKEPLLDYYEDPTDEQII